ncbi:MAG TPA: ABC transporter transmembrane domain-containing protein, partial [Longimicrobium sp.]
MILPNPRAGMPSGGPAPAAPAAEVPELRAAMGQFKRLTLLMRPFWGRLFKGIVAGGLIGMLGMVSPWITKLLIDEAYPTRDVTLMHVLVGASLALGASSMLMSGVQNYYNLNVNVLLNNSASLLFFNHLQHLPMRFFEEHRVGELMSRFGDVRRALQSVAKVFQTVLVQGIYLLMVPPFLFILQWKLALAALVSIPLTTTVIALTSRAMRKHWKRSAEAYGELNAHQTETLTQMRTLKSMGLESHTFLRTRGKMDGAMELELRAGGLGQVVTSANGLLHVANTALISWLGWRLILEGSMSLGDFMAFTAYLGFLFGPVNQFVGLLSEFQQSAVNLDRMFEYLDTAPEQAPAAAYLPVPPIAHRIHYGEVALEGVSFSYAPGKEALRDVSLTLRPGEVTAVVGHSGSGKTSLLRLLIRLEEAGSGRILIDGT